MKIENLTSGVVKAEERSGKTLECPSCTTYDDSTTVSLLLGTYRIFLNFGSLVKLFLAAVRVTSQRNYDNRRDIFDINPSIGRQEQEFLFNTTIDSRAIVRQ